MTYTAHDPRLVYDDIVSRVATSSGKNVGRVQAPGDRTHPYAVVYPLDDSGPATSLGDPTETTTHEFQVTSVGSSAEQAEWMSKKVRDALAAYVPTVSGYQMSPVERVGGQGTQRDDATQPAQFYTVDIFTVFTGAA